MIYDPLGRKVATLLDSLENTGAYILAWGVFEEAYEKLPAGAYIIGVEGSQSFPANMLVMSADQQ